MTVPDGGDLGAAGSTGNITWNYAGSPGSTVKLDLCNNSVAAGAISSSAVIDPDGSGSYGAFPVKERF